MESYTTNKQKRKVVALSVWVLPHEKDLIERRAGSEERSISNYCKRLILKEDKIKESDKDVKG